MPVNFEAVDGDVNPAGGGDGVVNGGEEQVAERMETTAPRPRRPGGGKTDERLLPSNLCLHPWLLNGFTTLLEEQLIGSGYLHESVHIQDSLRVPAALQRLEVFYISCSAKTTEPGVWDYGPLLLDELHHRKPLTESASNDLDLDVEKASSVLIAQWGCILQQSV
ncbi:hypothetical protein EYF80_030191 [Liparis tanakae]|uniref:Uncharacterized protein n=1 Tax=Liparis tanakae TaxID=230148 RepID=A0A4Z2H1H3_9TELE|nr:hypothetical protein EYF80_030191 [Liparis tanakae]